MSTRTTAHTDDLREQIDSLASLEGAGTELVTVTAPPETSLSSLRERVRQEYAAAESIKSDQTRDRVQRALNRLQRVLRSYGEMPESGLAVYAGVVDGELTTAVFDNLPTPVATSTYRCDSQFDVSPLTAAVAPGETFGLVAVERGGAAIGRLVGDRVIPIRTLDSQVMGKTRAGGQSAQRFKRERERQKHEFFQQVATVANEHLVDGDEIVTGVVVGGTLGTAKAFVAGEYLDHRLQERVLGTHPVEYGTRQGLHQLVERAESQLLDADRQAERDVLDAFFRRLRDDEPVTYGGEALERAIKYGAVETALLSTDIPQDRREDLAAAVQQQGGETQVISVETERGDQFAATFDGVGGLLRFDIRE